MDRRIDLTEHRDFGSSQDDTSMDTVFGITYEDEYMTIDTYDKICAWERVFGKRIHSSQARKLFHPEDNFYPPLTTSAKEGRCCCGAKLFPWDGYFCQRCRETIAMGFEWEERNGRYWSFLHSQNMRDERDILDLR